MYGRTRLRASFPPPLRGLKYLILVATLPLAAWWTDASGMELPYYCAYLCPAGTLQAGIPLIILNPALGQLAGWRFTWKIALMTVILITCLVMYRPFCRGLCPLGAFYGLLNRCSLWRLHLRAAACTGCGRCDSVCPAGLNVREQMNHPECIRCLRCVGACPEGALHWGLRGETEADI
ncbi:MAG: 4Fe-4S binding protein [Bacillota bacterium]